MSLLLLFSTDPAGPPSVKFSASLNFSAVGTVSIAPATVQFSASADLDTDAKATVPAAVAMTAAGDLSPGLPAVEVSWGSVTFTARATLTPTIIPRGKKRKAVVTDVFGAPLGELEQAKIGALTFELNRPDEFAVVVPVSDPKAGLLFEERIREVQIWRGDQLLTWGPAIRPSVDKHHVAAECRGALWHLTRRHIGKAERTNYVNNGSFEDGLAGWNMTTNEVAIFYNSPTAQPTPPIHSIVKFPTVTGKRALKLENYVAGADASAQQAFLWVTDEEASPDGDRWTLKGYVWLERFDNPATEGGRGLYLERFSTTELHPDPRVLAVNPNAPKSLEHVFVPIDEETPVGVWHRMEIGLETPPKAGEPERVNVRLYAPDGVVYWDAVTLTLEERLSFFGKDQTSEIAAAIVDHLQAAEYDKSDANISTSCPPSGVLRERIYVHSEHPNGFDALDEFTGLSNGFDFAVTYTPTARIFTTYFPERGRHWPRFALELGRNIADFAWTFDGEAGASAIVVLGQGEGSDREEGFAIDPEAFAGGLTLEEVLAAPPETPIDSLDNIALERLVTATAPEVLAVKTTKAQPGQADPIGVLWPGDTIPLKIRRGVFSLEATYRIQRLTINPDESLDLVLNLRSLTP